MKEEAAALSRDIENSLGAVVEEKNHMASFLDEMRVQFGEIVAETLKMEEFMGQYGFKSKNPVSLEEMLNWEAPVEMVTPAAAAEFGEELIENVEEPDLSIHETDTITSITDVKTKAKTPPVQQKSVSSDSPNFFDVGLSNLAMELYVGKSMKSNQPRPRQDAPPVKAPSPKNAKLEASVSSVSISNIPEASASPAGILKTKSALDFICNDSMYAASPVLRLSSKLTQQSDLSNMSNMSNTSAMDSVDITPGLPSRKKASAPVSSLPDTPPTARHAAVPAIIVDDDTPNLPELQTVNFAKFNWQQSSSASPDLPAVRLQSNQAARPSYTTPDLPRLPPASCDTPELPDLQTMDIRKLVRDSAAPVPRMMPADPVLTNNGRESTPEEPQLTGHYNQLKYLTTHLAATKSNTPEDPHLTTTTYNYQPHLANAFPLPKKGTPELPELSIMQERPDRAKSPETPVLSFNFRK